MMSCLSERKEAKEFVSVSNSSIFGRSHFDAFDQPASRKPTNQDANLVSVSVPADTVFRLLLVVLWFDGSERAAN